MLLGGFFYVTAFRTHYVFISVSLRQFFVFRDRFGFLEKSKVNPSSAQWSVCVVVVVSVISCHSTAAKKKKTTRKTSGTHNKYYLAHDSAGIQLILGWFWLILAGLDCVSAVSWSCLSLLRYLGNSCMIAGPEWPHLNILGTQMCLICLSSSIRLAGDILWGWWQRHKEKETSVCKSISSLCIISAISLAKAGHMAKKGIQEGVKNCDVFGHLWQWLNWNVFFFQRELASKFWQWFVGSQWSSANKHFRRLSEGTIPNDLWQQQNPLKEGYGLWGDCGEDSGCPPLLLKEKMFFLLFLYI